MEPHAASVMCVCVYVKASTAPLYADRHSRPLTHIHNSHPERAHSVTVSQRAGGVRATMTWAGICSRPTARAAEVHSGAQSWEEGQAGKG